MGNIIGIVAVDKNNGIGVDGTTLYRIKEDLVFFKEMTKGSVMIMGRRTYEDFIPYIKENDDRLFVVLSSSIDTVQHKNVLVYKTLEDIKMDVLPKFFGERKIFIIGGNRMWESFEMDEFYVTKILDERNCDCWFNTELLNKFENFEVISTITTTNGTNLSFTRYF